MTIKKYTRRPEEVEVFFHDEGGGTLSSEFYAWIGDYAEVYKMGGRWIFETESDFIEIGSGPFFIVKDSLGNFTPFKQEEFFAQHEILP